MSWQHFGGLYFSTSTVVIPDLNPKKGELSGRKRFSDCLPKNDAIHAVRIKKSNAEALGLAYFGGRGERVIISMKVSISSVTKLIADSSGSRESVSGARRIAGSAERLLRG